ncbi:hypothetical protein quinque_010718 [Culex quinquefasciatus]
MRDTERIHEGCQICLSATAGEEVEQGITYREAKKFCNVLHVIELDPAGDGETVGEKDDGEAAGVDELVQAVHNFIWSWTCTGRRATLSGRGHGGGGGAESGKEDETTEARQ